MNNTINVLSTKELQKLSNTNLVASNLQAKADEWRKTHEVLLHLQEVERRKLHLHLGYSSMHTYAVEKLGYSSGAAFRRIQAMRLLKDVPAVKQQFDSGALNLTTAAQIQNFCRMHRKPIEQKASLCRKFSGKSKREIEKGLLTLEWAQARAQAQTQDQNQTQSQLNNAIPPRRDRLTPLNAMYTEIKFCADQKLLAKLNKLQQMHSHKNLNQIFNLALNAALKIKKPSANKTRAHNPQRRQVPKRLAQEILQRADYRCEYTDPAANHRCQETKFLDIDHRLPVALGGLTTKNNLRVLCRAHNLYVAPKQTSSKNPRSV